MRELTSQEVLAVSGGNMQIEAEVAVVVGGTAGALTQMANGARIGAVLGPKGALGGAIIGGLAYSVGSLWYGMRDS